MVSRLEEYREAKLIFNQIKLELGITAEVKLGVMVEVPSVALMSDIFAREVDFFSIGTNDLSQYTLAIDRSNTSLATYVDHLHPAVLRNIELVVRGAQLTKIPVSVCGLMASEKLALPVLIGLGITELSMSINVIAENKALIRKLSLTECQTAAKKCLDMATAGEVRGYLTDKFATVLV